MKKQPKIRRSDTLVLESVARSRVGPSGWVRGNCPFCEERTGKPDRKKCLGLNVATAKWWCPRCGANGYVGRMPDDLADAAPTTVEAKQSAKAMEPPEGFFHLFEGDGLRSRSLDAPRHYLTGPRPPPGKKGPRGLDPEVLRAAKVGACVEGPYKGRVVVPVLGHDEDGDEVWFGWSSRPWVPSPKGMGYRYPEGMALSEMLYNHAALLVKTEVPSLIVEGVFDAHAIWPNGVAALGGTKGGHYAALLAAKRPVVLLPDGDAWEKGWLFAMRLRFEGQRSGAIRLPPKVDPDEVPTDVLQEAALRSLDQKIVAL